MRRNTYSQYGTCSKCGSQIIWIKTKAGKNMPCNSKIVNYIAGGKDKIVLATGEVVAGTITNDAVQADGHGYISHFATCEYHDMFRRKKKNAGR